VSRVSSSLDLRQKLHYTIGEGNPMKLKSIYHHLIWLLKGVQVLALIGRSGTGKSFRAQLLAQKYGINLIIDDGLLIKDQSIIAGRSAKKEKVKLTAVKTALFTDRGHVDEILTELQRQHFKRVLILGTSEKMVRSIAQRLDLPHPHRIINIDDVATKEEIDTARRARQNEGKHIIPVPSIEVRRNYPHMLLDSVRILIKKGLSLKKQPQVIEKTVVTPEFSSRGRVTISEGSLIQMVFHCVGEFDPNLKIIKVIVKEDRVNYSLEVVLNIPYGMQIAGRIHSLQQYILVNIEKFTGIILKKVDITIGRVSDTNNSASEHPQRSEGLKNTLRRFSGNT
jgi:uncharacterized alkaline shock family protein YloU